MKKIDTILIANRGEIASRIIRACTKLGIRSVAVYSDADKFSPFVKEADLAIHIGNSSPNESYLDYSKIIAAAKKSGADAIHPGYGFLSENVSFAIECTKEDLIFIGPHPVAIEMMGSKSKAKSLMKEHNVPVVPGYQGKEQSNEKLAEAAIDIGFPVLLKATAGGGGKGMRVVREEKELNSAIDAAKREAISSFGDDEMIVEKYIESGRHLEFQIFGDQHGNAIHLLERECTIQRRHQKVIEESPSPVMNEDLRKRMGEAAVKAAKALDYDNAGTVEFIYDDKSGDFYFLEVNTRLQVEHPVTEEITGLDLVEMQIESAQGYPLKIKQEDVIGRGYAIEVRLYAEDPANKFLPVTGKIEKLHIPKLDGVRVETAIQSGSDISIYYDPMIAKIIVHDKDRVSTQRKLRHVLKNLVCLGVTTNQDFLLHLCEQDDFQLGEYNTHYIQEIIMPDYKQDKNLEEINYALIAASIFDFNKRNQSRTILRSIPSGWRSNFYKPQSIRLDYNNQIYEVLYRSQEGIITFNIGEKEYSTALIESLQDTLRIEIDGIQYSFVVMKKNNIFYIHNEIIGSIKLVQQDRFPETIKEKVPGTYEAPMPSQVVKIMVEVGTLVKEGDELIILSSMKMENTLYADVEGTVKDIFTTEGANIEAGTILMKIDK